MRLYKTTFYSRNGSENHSYWEEPPVFDDYEVVDIEVIDKGNVTLYGHSFRTIIYTYEGETHTMAFDADEGFIID